MLFFNNLSLVSNTKGLNVEENMNLTIETGGEQTILVFIIYWCTLSQLKIVFQEQFTNQVNFCK